MTKRRPPTDGTNTDEQSGIAGLRTAYKKLLGCEPPSAFGPDLLKLSIVYETQRRIHGGLSRLAQRELRRLAKSARAAGSPPSPVRRIGRNAALIREWNGQQHRVRTVDGGYEYDGEIYNNLSQIARLITGTRWNGPRFFGLREASA